jgi:hypothetical protein
MEKFINRMLDKIFKEKRKEFSKLKVGSVLMVPSDVNRVRAGFEKYDTPKYYFKVIDINENGMMYDIYSCKKDLEEEIPAGTKINTRFKNSWEIEHDLVYKELIIVDKSLLEKLINENK